MGNSILQGMAEQRCYQMGSSSPLDTRRRQQESFLENTSSRNLLGTKCQMDTMKLGSLSEMEYQLGSSSLLDTASRLRCQKGSSSLEDTR